MVPKVFEALIIYFHKNPLKCFISSVNNTFKVQDLKKREGKQYKSYKRMWHLTMKMKGEESGFE